MEGRRADQQQGRQGNDYQNFTVREGGRGVFGNIHEKPEFRCHGLPSYYDRYRSSGHLFLAVLSGGVPQVARPRTQGIAPRIHVDQGKAWCWQIDSYETRSVTCTESESERHHGDLILLQCSGPWA
jgi:hypothetical protein